MNAPALATFTIVLVASSVANAQVKWDLGAQGGAMKRWGDGLGVGPVGELHAHVALVPTVRVGAWFEGDVSPQENRDARRVLAGGGRIKWTPPWPGGSWRTWIFAGAGYASVDGEGYFDAPLGAGLALKLTPMWALTAELGSQLGRREVLGVFACLGVSFQP